MNVGGDNHKNEPSTKDEYYNNITIQMYCRGNSTDTNLIGYQLSKLKGVKFRVEKAYQ